MDDQLEKFIFQKREAFDDEIPSEKVWSGINNELKKQTSFFQYGWKVAAVLFLISTLYLLADKYAFTEQEGPTFSLEFTQAEDYYTRLISEKRTEIEQKLTPEQHKEFLAEIDLLDELYVELKQTYQTNAASDRLLDAMINNLQLRLSIINKQLTILENIKEQKENESFTI
ncbi:MAG: hypothetical protein AAGA66_21805 [Bacteroidota bacterium]